MKKKIIIGAFLLNIIFVPYVCADTHTASSCSYGDVKAAVRAASDGDTVIVPICASTSWTSKLTISKAIRFQGAGIDRTIINQSVVRSPMILVSLVANKTTTIAGFTFTSDRGVDPGVSHGVIEISGDSGHLGRFRIAHNKFNAPDTRTMIAYNAYGLYDHNTVIIKFGRQAMEVNMSAYGGGMYGDQSWKVPYTWGSADAVFIEDNNFSCSGTCDARALSSLDAVDGARVVFRYNTVNESYITNHGADTGGRSRSAMAYEIYNNTFHTIHWRNTGIYLRGGTALIYNNAFTTTGGNWNSQVLLSNFRSLDAGDCAHNACFFRSCMNSNANIQVCSKWTTRDSATCASQGGRMLGPIDNPAGGGAGYPCLDQVGRGYHTDGIGHAQANIPVLIWNNTGAGNKVSVSGGPPAPDVGSHIQSNRDYCQGDTTMPATCNGVATRFASYAYPHPLATAITLTAVDTAGGGGSKGSK